jgi:hypothetical protein
LFGHGFVGELGSVASILGLILQLALIALLCRLIWRWWSGRNAPAFAGLSPRQLADPYLRSRDDVHAGLDSAAAEEDQNNAAQSEQAGQIKQIQKPGA